MAKVKVKKQGILNVDEFRTKVDRVALLEAELTAKATRHKVLVQRMKDKLSATVAEAEKEVKELLGQLADYAADHEAEVLEKGKRSGETPAARYGFRMGNKQLKAAKGAKLADALDLLRQQKAEVQALWLRFKDPELDKEAILARMGEDDLQKYRLQVVQEDSFFVEGKGKEERE